MEMIMAKEKSASLPIVVASPSSATSTGTLDAVSKRADQRAGAFSEKLSAALDKPVQPEPDEQKASKKSKTDANEESQRKKTFPRLPVGMVWSFPVNELIVPATNAVNQEESPNAASLNSAGSFNVLPLIEGLATAGIAPALQTIVQPFFQESKANAFVIEGMTPVEGTTADSPLLELAQMSTAKSSTSGPVGSKKPVNTEVSPLTLKADVKVDTRSGPLMDFVDPKQLQNVLSTQESAAATIGVKSVETRSGLQMDSVDPKLLQDVLSIQLSASPTEVRSPVVPDTILIGDVSSDKTNLGSQMASVDPKLLQDVLSIQVPAATTIVNSTSMPNTISIVDVKQAEIKLNPYFDPTFSQDDAPIQVSVDTELAKSSVEPDQMPKGESKASDARVDSIIGMMDESVGKNGVSANENELFDGSLGQAKSDSIPQVDAQNDSAGMAAVTFDRVFNSVDQALNTSTVASQPRQDLHEVARQVMDGMTTSADRLKTSQVIITLKPEHLGEVTVKIKVDGDRVTAAFHAASSEVRAILESSLPQLRQEMSQQGWNFDSNGVFGGMQEFLANQQQQRQSAQEQQIMQNAHRLHREEYDDVMAFTPGGQPQIMSAASVDYRI